MKNDQETPLWIYVALSLVLHLLVYLLLHLSLPPFKKEYKDEVMSFEVLPVQKASNIKTKKVQKQKKKVEQKSKKLSKSKKSTLKPKSAPKKVIKKESSPKVKPKKATPKKIVQKKVPAKTQQKAKPKQKVNEMEKLLKNLEKESQGKEAKSRKKSVSKKSSAIDDAIGKYKEKTPMSIGEVEYVRQKIIQNWNVPIGVKDAGEITVKFYINLNPDGSINDVKLVGHQCPMGADIACRAAVDSAIRAVKEASPFNDLRPDRYETWAEFKINFKPEDAMM